MIHDARARGQVPSAATRAVRLHHGGLSRLERRAATSAPGIRARPSRCSQPGRLEASVPHRHDRARLVRTPSIPAERVLVVRPDSSRRTRRKESGQRQLTRRFSTLLLPIRSCPLSSHSTLHPGRCAAIAERRSAGETRSSAMNMRRNRVVIVARTTSAACSRSRAQRTRHPIARSSVDIRLRHRTSSDTRRTHRAVGQIMVRPNPLSLRPGLSTRWPPHAVHRRGQQIRPRSANRCGFAPLRRQRSHSSAKGCKTSLLVTPARAIALARRRRPQSASRRTLSGPDSATSVAPRGPL